MCTDISKHHQYVALLCGCEEGVRKTNLSRQLLTLNSYFTPSLQEQAPTPQSASTWCRPPPGPTCPGRWAMMEAFSRHSQSGMAMCESSQHALLPAFSSFNTSSVVSKKCLFKGQRPFLLCCCYCFAAAWLGNRPGLTFLIYLITWIRGWL